ncbi:DegQ family serine endoprotease [Wolbachia endosymbiont of Pentidionis agamae]|uniref:DegQ family serine endoprotease n=1 Tax=Wolbachia endosymbiont of Pentidionis agamae TaxID=3110435 RepID=UPI002FCF2403
MKRTIYILFILISFLCSLSSYAKHSTEIDEKLTDQNNKNLNQTKSLADLVEVLIPAVVNISSEQIIKQDYDSKSKIHSWPRNNFFDEFKDFFENFDQFFMYRSPNVNKEIISLGSGFIIDKNGIIVTNYHVIKNAKEITVTTSDNSFYKAKILGQDVKTDLAVLKIYTDKPLSYVKLGDSDKAKVGDTVIAIGNPFGLGGSVSTGIISARSRDISIGTIGEFIQTDAAINKGNSGGPLFNTSGEVIGINTAIFSPSESGGNVGIGFAIPSTSVVGIIDELKNGKKVKHGWLGVQVQPITKEFANSLGLKGTNGALVAYVVKDSPADKAKIKGGDIILEFNGEKIERMVQLPYAVSKTKPGNKVTVKVLRGGKEVSRHVTVGESSSEEDQGDNNVLYNQEKNQLKSDQIGLTVANLSSESQEKHGIIVVDVDSNSNAALRGIRKGDIILQVNQFDVKNVNDFHKEVTEVAKKEDRDSILLLIKRNGNHFFLSIKLTNKIDIIK